MLRAARARLAPHANVTVESGTLEALPLADASVDAAYLTLVLHHVSDPAAVLSEAARILKPGGRVVITDMAPHDREEYRQQMGHVWLGFSEKKLAQFVTAAHLADLRIVPLTADAKARGPALFTAVALRPIVSGRDAATSESVTRSIAS
jgi:ubiquinone/menaquinone biosynthesis C-methylase UbiE